MSDSTTEARDDAATRSSFAATTAGIEPRFSVLTGDQELQAQAAVHRHELSLARLRHQQDEERKRNELRRHQEIITFYVVVCVIALGLVVGSFIAIQAEDADTRAWAQNGVTVLIGGIVGGIAGYFTGRAGR